MNNTIETLKEELKTPHNDFKSIMKEAQKRDIENFEKSLKAKKERHQELLNVQAFIKKDVEDSEANIASIEVMIARVKKNPL